MQNEKRYWFSPVKKKFIVIVLLFFTATAVVLVHDVTSLTPDIVPLFTDNVNATVISPDVTEVEQELLDQINQAVSSIDGAIYEFNRASIRDALIQAHQRGVNIRMVTDDDAYANPGFQPFFAALEAEGIPVVNDGRSSLMHNKFFVFDETAVWTGSMNMTNTDFTLNHNDALVITSTQLAEIYQIEFEEMFLDGRFGTSKFDNTSHMVTIDGNLVEIYFSPTDFAMNEVIAEVNAASDSIYFSIFFLTNDDLRDALLVKMAEGVPVYGVWDALGAGNLYSDDEALCAAGAYISIENFPGKVHHKFMVIDPGEADARVVSGSMNWSQAGAAANDENTLILHDPALAQAYLGAYQTLFQALPLSSLCNSHMTFLPTLVGP